MEVRRHVLAEILETNRRARELLGEQSVLGS